MRLAKHEYIEKCDLDEINRIVYLDVEVEQKLIFLNEVAAKYENKNPKVFYLISTIFYNHGDYARALSYISCCLILDKENFLYYQLLNSIIKRLDIPILEDFVTREGLIKKKKNLRFLKISKDDLETL